MDEGSKVVDSVVNGSLDVFEDVGGASPEDDRGQLAVLSISLEDNHPLGGDFLDTDVIGTAGLVGSGLLQL